MSPGAHTERAFEDRVEYELLRLWVGAGLRAVQRRAGDSYRGAVGVRGADADQEVEQAHRASRR